MACDRATCRAAEKATHLDRGRGGGTTARARSAQLPAIGFQRPVIAGRGPGLAALEHQCHIDPIDLGVACEMAVADFVKQKYGADVAGRLSRINTGGLSNQKGHEFENHYAVVRICSIAANQADLDKYLISTQEEAFVDDLCIRDNKTFCKTNYQAKNSAGAPADWTADTTSRFEMQRDIDENFHQFPVNRQVLLVSDADKAAANDGKIPDHMRNYCSSEHYHHQPTPTRLIMGDPALRQDLSSICQTNTIDMLTYAFQLVLSAWVSDGTRQRSVGDLIGEANAMAHPEIFAKHMPHRGPVPAWLTEKCYAFPAMEARVEFGAFVVSFAGFEASLGSNPREPDVAELAAITEADDFFEFLMSIAAEELSRAAELKQVV